MSNPPIIPNPPIIRDSRVRTLWMVPKVGFFIGLKWLKTQEASRAVITFLTKFSYIERQKTMQGITWSHFIALLHKQANTFCGRTNNPKSRNTPDKPDFCLANKVFHNNFCVFMIISALLNLFHLLSLHKSLVYPPFV